MHCGQNESQRWTQQRLILFSAIVRLMVIWFCVALIDIDKT